MVNDSSSTINQSRSVSPFELEHEHEHERERENEGEGEGELDQPQAGGGGGGRSSAAKSYGILNPRQIIAGLVLGILFTLLNKSKSINSFTTKLGFPSSSSTSRNSMSTYGLNSPDHVSWKTWHTVQLNTPFVPNHDPNNLDQPPPSDIADRHPNKKKAEPGMTPKKMVLPKKLDLHRSDEL